MENKKELYNQIDQYYDFAEQLSTEIGAQNDAVGINEKTKILSPMINDLRTTADRLIGDYVRCLKDKTNYALTETLRKTFDELILKIEKCKNKVYELYKN